LANTYTYILKNIHQSLGIEQMSSKNVEDHQVVRVMISIET